MTREEAIKELKGYEDGLDLEYATPFDKAILYAIQALSQEPCTDAVSRGVFEQVMWERDIAIEQLHELGYELGQKIEPCDDAISLKYRVIDLANAIESDDSGYWTKKRILSALWNISSTVQHNSNAGKNTLDDAISRQAVKEQMIKYGFHAPDMTVTEFVEDLPSVNPQPCDDAISRNWLKTAIHNFYYGLNHTPSEEDIQAYINAAPSVPQKSGKWIEHEIEDTLRWVTCSECNCEMHKKFNFCPNCGAKMVEPQESEEQTDAT